METIKDEFDTVVKPDGTMEQVLRSRTRTVTTRMERSNALLVRQLVAYCPEFKEAREVRHGSISGEAVEVRVPERTPERVEKLVKTMLELGIGREDADPGVCDVAPRLPLARCIEATRVGTVGP